MVILILEVTCSSQITSNLRKKLLVNFQLATIIILHEKRTFESKFFKKLLLFWLELIIFNVKE